ncbi:MAG: hypothetical protein IKR41_07385 [Bacteroidales bacterium]|nr:hypothetical protein [Bacteroidales bacterium]
MISKNCIKHINSLELKKFRTLSGTFIAQGRKVVDELLRSRLKIKTVYALKSWIEKNSENFQDVEIQEVSPEEIKKLSDMQTPPEV